jgi:hypothetical protein
MNKTADYYYVRNPQGSVPPSAPVPHFRDKENPSSQNSQAVPGPGGLSEFVTPGSRPPSAHGWKSNNMEKTIAVFSPPHLNHMDVVQNTSVGGSVQSATTAPAALHSDKAHRQPHSNYNAPTNPNTPRLAMEIGQHASRARYPSHNSYNVSHSSASAETPKGTYAEGYDPQRISSASDFAQRMTERGNNQDSISAVPSAQSFEYSASHSKLTSDTFSSMVNQLKSPDLTAPRPSLTASPRIQKLQEQLITSTSGVPPSRSSENAQGTIPHLDRRMSSWNAVTPTQGNTFGSFIVDDRDPGQRGESKTEHAGYGMKQPSFQHPKLAEILSEDSKNKATASSNSTYALEKSITQAQVPSTWVIPNRTESSQYPQRISSASQQAAEREKRLSAAGKPPSPSMNSLNHKSSSTKTHWPTPPSPAQPLISTPQSRQDISLAKSPEFRGGRSLQVSSTTESPSKSSGGSASTLNSSPHRTNAPQSVDTSANQGSPFAEGNRIVLGSSQAVPAAESQQVPRVSHVSSDESLLKTPSSLAPSLKPVVSRSSITASLSSQQEPRKKVGFFDMFRAKKPSRAESPSYEIWYPSEESDRENIPSRSKTRKLTKGHSSDADTKPLSSRVKPPAPINIPYNGKTSEEKPFTPFRYLTSKRHRTVSAASLEAINGTAVSFLSKLVEGSIYLMP